MEEGGHYYTVYYTSLAVGFKEAVAYRHAVLSQMPDEVLWMDAAHMQTQQCRGYFGGRETDLNNVTRYVPADERYRVQYGLHSLPGRGLNEATRSSAYQRQITSLELSKQSPVSLKFGLLLHRLGDTYAHSKMGHEQTMYTVTQTDKCFSADNYKESFGHLFDMHDPDYPFLRQNLFFSYLQNLYQVLFNKLQEPASASYRKNISARPFHQVKGDFEILFMRLTDRARADEKQMQDSMNMFAESSGSTAPATSSVTKAKWLIEEIRTAALRNLNVQMRRYSPEREDGMSLNQFLGNHPELNDLNINSNNLTDTINKMIPQNSR
jgi:hypothetical protein